MKTIRKTWKKATYFEGAFSLRNKQTNNWATPIDFPTVFVAYGKGIKSGNWQACTNINTPGYVINNYFDTVGGEVHHKMYNLFQYCTLLSKVTWEQVETEKDSVLKLINSANNELNKLEKL